MIRNDQVVARGGICFRGGCGQHLAHRDGWETNYFSFWGLSTRQRLVFVWLVSGDRVCRIRTTSSPAVASRHRGPSNKVQSSETCFVSLKMSKNGLDGPLPAHVAVNRVERGGIGERVEREDAIA